MKKILIILLIATGCSQEEPFEGKWEFSAYQFSGTFTINSDGNGSGTFMVNNKTYQAVNSDILQGSSIVMYAEDGAYVGLHQVDFPISKYQEYREGGLPVPYENQVRSSTLTLVRTR